MFEMTFSDGIKRGMAFDGHAKHPVFVTKGNSMISKKDWPRLRHAFDALPESLSTSHLPPSTEKGPWHDTVRRKEFLRDGASPPPHASDDEDGEEVGVEAMRKYLRENTGLSEDAISEACEIAAREHGEPAEDYLPASGLKSAGGAGGRLSGARSRLGEGSRPASDGFEFPKENLAPHYEPPARNRRIAADHAGGEARLLRMFGPDGPARVEVGEWPKRR
jgi:hypothetical protein